MAGNPTVIPGLARADLSGLANLAEAIGMYMTRDKRKIESAMQLYRDPEFMEKAATDMVAAQARDELDPNFANIAADASAPSELSRVQDSYMLAAGLDPSNQKHRDAALGILGTAFQSLPVRQRAEARFGVTEEARKVARETVKAEAEVGRDVAKLQKTEVNMAQEAMTQAQEIGTHLQEVELKAMANDLQKIAFQMMGANTAQRAALLQKVPELAALYSVSPEAFAQGLIAMMGASGEGGLDPADIKILQEAQEKRDVDFIAKLQEASQMSGPDAEAKLSEALSGYQSYEQYGRLLPQSRFPVGFETYLSGWLRQSTRVQLMFSLPPEGTGFNAEGWAEWVNLIADAYATADSDEERKTVEAFMTSSDRWKVMNDAQREQTIAQFKGLDVIWTDLIISYRALRAARQAEIERQREEGAGFGATPPILEGLTGPGGQPVYPRQE